MPSVDVMGGKVVRLVKGDPSRCRVYSEDPVGTARKWREQGARGLHIVDLDAALEQGSNLRVVEEIVKSVDVDLEVGGGVRSLQQAVSLLEAGVDRVMLGTVALSDKGVVSSLVGRYGGGRVMVALDYLGGRVMVRGWRMASKPLSEALEEFKEKGVRRFLLTDVSRDGTLEGPDVEALTTYTRIPGIQVIASGGVRDLQDLVSLKKVGVAGVVVGTALYEGAFTLQEALRAVED